MKWMNDGGEYRRKAFFEAVELLVEQTNIQPPHLTLENVLMDIGAIFLNYAEQCVIVKLPNSI